MQKKIKPGLNGAFCILGDKRLKSFKYHYVTESEKHRLELHVVFLLNSWDSSKFVDKFGLWTPS